MENDIKELTNLMSDISEEGYCAGWLIDLEYMLWNLITDSDNEREFGLAILSDRDIEVMQKLSNKINGWIHWDNDKGESYIPMDEWLKKYEVWQKKWHSK